MITVEAKYVEVKQGKGKSQKKFDGFRAVVGEKVYDPIPISFLRISELLKLQQMLEEAYNEGRNDEAREAAR